MHEEEEKKPTFINFGPLERWYSLVVKNMGVTIRRGLRQKGQK
jgi:hypothetical protein